MQVRLIFSKVFPLFHWKVVTCIMSLVDLPRSYNVLFVLCKLIPVGEPPAESRQSEQASEELRRHLECFVYHTGVEIDVKMPHVCGPA